jgi:hypothetical protein
MLEIRKEGDKMHPSAELHSSSRGIFIVRFGCIWFEKECSFRMQEQLIHRNQL